MKILKKKILHWNVKFKIIITRSKLKSIKLKKIFKN